MFSISRKKNKTMLDRVIQNYLNNNSNTKLIIIDIPNNDLGGVLK